MRIRLRNAAIQDATAMTDLDRECFPPEQAFPYRLFFQCIRGKNAISLVAEDENGRFVGFVIAENQGGVANLLTIDVTPIFRRLGAATVLMEGIFAALIEKDVEKLFLQVYIKNTPALTFYLKLGFVKEGLISDYYGENKDAWAMGKTLSKPGLGTVNQ